MLIVCCPACHTVFRVHPEQLRTRSGRVRCGHCYRPFNAIEHLLDQETLPAAPAASLHPDSGAPPPHPAASEVEAAAEWAPHLQPDEPPSATDEATPPAPAIDLLDFAIPDALLPPRRAAPPEVSAPRPAAGHEPSPEPDSPALEEEPDTQPGEPLPSLSPDTEPTWMPAMFESERTPDRKNPFAEPPPEPEPPAAPEDAPVLAPGHAGARDPAPPFQRDHPAPDPNEQSARRERLRRLATGTLIAEQMPHDTARTQVAVSEPDWSAPQPSPTGGSAIAPRKAASGWAQGLVIGILAGTLAAQASYVFRQDIARKWPETRPLFLQLCERLGCTMPLPRNITAIRIESSNLESDPSDATRFTLIVQVGNEAPYPQQVPHLELTLTDLRDRPLIRRVLQPQEWVPAERHGPEMAFAPYGVIEASIPFEGAQALGATGYRVYAFYP